MTTGQALRSSLRWRLLLATWSITGVAVVLAGVVLAGLFRDHVMRQFEAALVTHLDQLTAQLQIDGQERPQIDPKALTDPRWLRPLSGLYWQIDAASDMGNSLAVQRSRSLWDVRLQLPRDTLSDGQLHAHRVQGPAAQDLWAVERTLRLQETTNAQRWRLIVAADLSATEAGMKAFNRVLAWSLGVLWLLLSLAAWMQVQVGLSPLRALHRALQSLRQGEHVRLQGVFPTEVQALVTDFNAVLDVQDRNAKRARTVAGNLAHALKTPLTILSQAAGSASHGKVAAGLVLEQVQQAQRHLDWHLAQARRMPAQAVSVRATPVQDVVEGLIRVIQRIYADRQLQLQVRVAEGVRFAGDAQDLQEILGNLLDNACKWASKRVVVNANRVPGSTPAVFSVSIEDDGPGIAVDALSRALVRGVRLDESTPGSGLGLAIVADAVKGYGGRLTLGAGSLGGLSAEVVLPAA